MAQSNFEPTWALIKRPAGYPTGPAVGKPALILQSQGNDHALYHRLSPYSNYHQGLISWGDEPYYYIYPDQAKNFPQSLKKYDSHTFAPGSGIIDVIRTTKFLTSGRGIGFLATQFLLQTASPYNERRIYNPTSPIVAAGLTLTLGSARPDRAFDTSAGLAGIASSLLGSLGSTIFGPPKQNPVSGTALASNTDALPDANKSFAAKANLRAGTALRGQANLQAAWPGTSNGGSSSGGFLSSIKGIVTALFQNFIPQNQTNIHFRSDEGAYGMMMATDFKFTDDNGYTLGPTWIAGKTGTKNIRKKGEYPTAPYKLYSQVQNGVLKFVRVSTKGSVSFTISNGYSVGYTASESSIEKKPGYRYGDSMGAQKSTDFEASEMMVQYNFYEKQDFPTKNPDQNKPDVLKINETLKNTIRAIRNASGGTYTVDDSEPGIIREGFIDKYDYNRLVSSKKQTNGKPNALNQPLSSVSIYRTSGVKMVSTDISTDNNNSLKMATGGRFDAINVLSVMDKNKSTGSPLAGWTTWDAYRDDSIAVFFYDVVNDKYIPFRSAIKGLSESGNASWEELPFIGRADKVYSYGGFNRNASFTIKIVINSIKELAPTWQRINYINTAYKPANYTKAPGGSSRYDRFLVPPMFFLTLGDFYRDQPILIQSVVTTVPDDATWETQNEDNNAGGWDYMAKLIKAPGSKYGQVPREVELGFTVTLLEKERALVGGANFGHAPRDEDFNPYNTDTPNGKSPNDWNDNLLVEV